MSRQTVAVDQIELVPSGFFTVHYDFRSPAGLLGVLTVPAFRRDSTFRDADGREWTMRSRSLWRNEYGMYLEGEAVAVARPRGFWKSSLDVFFPDQSCLLEPTRWWSDRWRLSGADGSPLLEIRRRGALRQGLIAELLGPLRVEQIAFACYLVLARWRERAAAAAASA